MARLKLRKRGQDVPEKNHHHLFCGHILIKQLCQMWLRPISSREFLLPFWKRYPQSRGLILKLTGVWCKVREFVMIFASQTAWIYTDENEQWNQWNP